MTDRPVTIPLLLFAKSPIAGQVKTRLLPTCTATQAAEIAKILMEESIRKATSFWNGPVLLCIWPNQDDKFVQLMASRYAISVVSQAEGDLGEKMLAAFGCHGYPAAIMGCDAPQVADAALSETFTHLLVGDNVLGGSEDGGYYLIGLANACPFLFENIKWGSDSVLQATLRRAQLHSLEFIRLPELNDVDTWEDVLQVAGQLPSLRSYITGQGLTGETI